MNENINFIIEYFKKNLPQFNLTSEFSNGPYWGIKFSNVEIEIVIEGDIGFGVEIIIESKKYPLWQYDKRVNEAMQTNQKNLQFQLDILKNFLKEESTSNTKFKV